ncbi:MAG TPA: prolyl aminopeptidase [Tepidiformaceae bacterium]|nr:prolyl aminopeptidase [Tepidiformaceae bacterium]
MADLYPPIEPYQHGMLDAGDGHRVYWEQCGNPGGKPALVIHGGPGSGCTPWHRRLFDPARYRIVLFDQRNCGRSTPHASVPDIDLSSNTTSHLVADIELLRVTLGIERWLVLGGSWGCTLGLAYAEQFVEHVSEIVFWGVTTGRWSEADWAFRDGIEHFFPEQCARRRSALPPELRDIDVVEAYARLLGDADPAVRDHAAFEWCLWESASPEWPPVPGLAKRYEEPAFRLAFARMVTHYVRHNLFLEDGVLISHANCLAAIPGILITGRFDFGAPMSNAYILQQAWPGAELIIVQNAGHSGSQPGITNELLRATDRFAN